MIPSERRIYESTSSFFLSLVLWISLVNFKQGLALVKFVFSLYFPRILWVRSEQKIIGKSEVFP